MDYLLLRFATRTASLILPRLGFPLPPLWNVQPTIQSTVLHSVTHKRPISVCELSYCMEAPRLIVANVPFVCLRIREHIPLGPVLKVYRQMNYGKWISYMLTSFQRNPISTRWLKLTFPVGSPMTSFFFFFFNQ